MSTTTLPFSDACERNKGPILEVLRSAFADRHAVLEIGAGTGQHAVHFARHLQHLTWQPTDRADLLPGLSARIATEGGDLPNLRAPVELDVRQTRWPVVPGCDAVYTANTLHIMAWPEVEAFFRGLRQVPARGALLAVYGPFRYGGRFTSDSNAAFDRSLRDRDPASGIRDFEAVGRLAAGAGFVLEIDHAMPANNQLLIWQRASTA